MQYDVKTPNEYLDQLENDWKQEKLLQLRAWILSHQSAPSEFIQYKMLAYGLENNTVFHLNAQKNYVSLYIGNVDKVENGRALLDGLDMGKGCIRIKKSINLKDTNLEEFIRKAIDQWRIGSDLNC